MSLCDRLQKECMVLVVNVSQWTARKDDKQMTEKCKHIAGRGKWIKEAIAKEHLKDIQQNVNRTRVWYRENTLPGIRDGERLLPKANYFTAIEELRHLQQGFRDSLEKFLENYPEYVDQAQWMDKEKTERNPGFNWKDYPTDIRSKFGYEIKCFPVPNYGGSILNDSEEDERLKREGMAAVQEIVQAATADLWKRLQALVKHVQEGLVTLPDGKYKTFKDSLVNNILELNELLPRLNFTADAGLSGMMQEINDRLTTYEPDVLREDEAAREEVKRAANDIANKMAAYFS